MTHFTSILHTTVRYSETDQMGVVHHANYLLYLEQARIEWLKKLGFSYAQMEQDGVMLPVTEIHLKYKKPLRFEDEIIINIALKKIPTSRIVFDYEIVTKKEQLHALASTTLIFMNSTTRRPCRPPADFMKKVQSVYPDLG